MRALVLAALLLAPAALAQAPQAPVAVLDEAGSILALDTAHLTAKLRFRVTNPGAAADYVTVPRFDIRWVDTGQTALGVPTPEFGLALAAGATGEMWVRVDVAEPRAGTFTVSVPFRSEATGATSTVRVPLTVAPAPAPTATLRVTVVDERGAPVPEAAVEVTELTSTTRGSPPPQRDPSGAWSLRLAPGEYAIRASAADKADAFAFRTLAADGTAAVELRLAPPRREARLVSTWGHTVGDSVWLLAGSDDLSTLATAPMTHKTHSTPGAFHALRDGEEAWRATFPPPAQPKHAAGPFQALDTAAAVSPDGALVAGFDWNGMLHVYDAETGVERWSTDQSGARNPLYPPASPFGEGFFTSGAVAFSPDGARLVAGGSSGWTAAFDARTGEVLWTRAFGGEVRAVRFLPDGDGVVVGAGDWRMRMLDADEGGTRWEAPNEFWPFFFVALSGDASLVASGGKDAALRVWNATTGAEALAVDVWPGFVSGAGFAGDSVVFSDWQFGVRRVGLDGEERWFRRFPTANVATTPDGAYALVAWAREGGSAGGIELLDEGGTTLWGYAPDLPNVCATDVSPFPARQLKSVHLADLGGGRLRGAVACIGGGVIVFDLHVKAAAAPPLTTTSTPPTATTHADPPPGTRPTPPTTGTSPPTQQETPLPWWPALAAIAAAAARRGPRAAPRGPARRGSP